MTYERKGRRDPFDPIDVADAALTSPTLGSARLKGIVRSRTPRALVETSDGLGYILKVGDMLGEGRLVEIGVDTVVFSVPLRRGAGTTRMVLRLPDD
jgi:Tfp pilus assembly protein PilP